MLRYHLIPASRRLKPSQGPKPNCSQGWDGYNTPGYVGAKTCSAWKDCVQQFWLPLQKYTIKVRQKKLKNCTHWDKRWKGKPRGGIRIRLHLTERYLDTWWEYNDTSGLKMNMSNFVDIAIYLDRVSVCITWQWYCTAIRWEFWSRDTDVEIMLSIISTKNEKLFNSINNRRKPKFFRLLWYIVVFRSVAYLLNMIFLNLQF